jgi:hypothetical protein
MRRRMPVVAVLGAFAALAAGTLAAIVAVSPQPEPRAVDEDPMIPADLTWAWISDCVPWPNTVNFGVTAFSIDDEGVATLELGFADEAGEITVDPERTAAANACVQARRVDPAIGTRPATEAERALIYDWTVRWQGPCLASRGFDVRPALRRDFLDAHQVAWFLLDRYSDNSFIPFDTMLEARLACSPMPPYLTADGVGW